jgi:hypothetical protein
VKMLWSILSLLLISNACFADLFRCKVDGKTVFSDKACSSEAQKIQLNVYRPKAEEAEKQREITKRNNQDALYSQWDELRSENTRLENKIVQLQQQWQQETTLLSKKLYRYSDTMVATSEPDLFNKMAQVDKRYQQQINNIKLTIRQNEHNMFNIKSLIDADN